MEVIDARARTAIRLCVPRWLLQAGTSVLLALAVALLAVRGVESAPPPSPTPTSTSTATSTSTVVTHAVATPTATSTPAPTRTPSATPSPTPVPAQDLAVVFFNNFCELGQPLMATVFNTSATPLTNRTVRLRLSTDAEVLEEHDHYLSLAPRSSVNLPLANVAQPPLVKIEVEVLDGPADPNPANDSSSCGVPAPAGFEPAAEPTQRPSGRAVPSGGASSGSTVRQAASQPTAPPQATRAPARAQTTLVQPSLTPIGSAGGGVAPQTAERGLLPSRTLMLAGVVFLTGGTSWAFYYLTRPPRNA